MQFVFECNPVLKTEPLFYIWSIGYECCIMCTCVYTNVHIQILSHELGGTYVHVNREHLISEVCPTTDGIASSRCLSPPSIPHSSNIPIVPDVVGPAGHFQSFANPFFPPVDCIKSRFNAMLCMWFCMFQLWAEGTSSACVARCWGEATEEWTCQHTSICMSSLRTSMLHSS